MTPSDPSTWQSASYSPDMASSLDTLEDLIVERAHERLKMLSLDARKRIVPVVAEVAMGCIREATSKGLLHDEDSAVFTDKFKEILVRILSEIHASTNPRMHIDCLSFAFGLSLRQGISLTSIAEEHGVTRACPSKICVQMCQQYGIPPSRGMKAEEARDTFSKRQVGKMAKPRAEEYKGLQNLKENFRRASKLSQTSGGAFQRTVMVEEGTATA